MDNIFITALTPWIFIQEDFGDFIDENDLIIQYHNCKEDKDEFEQELNKSANIRPDWRYLLEDLKYLYFLTSYSTPKHYGHLIKYDNIYMNYFKTEEDAIRSGIKNIKSGIYRDNIRLGSIDEDDNITEENINVLDYEDYTNYTFTICKILVNRHAFINNEDEIYYNENLSNIKKENLYDFLLDLVGGYQINHYNIDGKLYDISIIDNYRNIYNLSLKSLLGYHVNKFKIGDKVKVKIPYYKNNTFIIKNKIIQNDSIYESKDPLHFREGYILVFDNEYIGTDQEELLNEYMDDLFYDEDLELVD